MWHHHFMVEVIIDRAAIIKLLRTQLDLGQHQLGVNKGTVNLLEKRKRKTDEDSLNKITKRLGVTLRYIDDVVDILNGRMKPAPLQHEIGICKDHLMLMQRLDVVLDKDPRWIPTIESFIGAAGGAPSPESKNFRASDLPSFGDEVELPSGKKITVGQRGKR
jgi:hypothetical protein